MVGYGGNSMAVTASNNVFVFPSNPSGPRIFKIDTSGAGGVLSYAFGLGVADASNKLKIN